MENLKISENRDQSSSRINETQSDNLSETFENGLSLFTSILETNEPTNSFKVQSDVKRAISMMEDATKLVSVADIFSNNESLEDVPTENLKYFMLPVILGTLVTKLCNVNDRAHLVDVAHIYFADFLQRAKSYGITDYEVPDNESRELTSHTADRPLSNSDKITKMVNTRENKLERYRQRKELETRFSVLKESKNNPNIDDETLRDYFVTWLKCYVNSAIDELEALKTEKQVLDYMKTLPPDEHREGIHKAKMPVSKLKPVIITRDAAQKMVFGAGYPSLPVLTVQEFYDKRVEDGDWPDPSQRNQDGGKSFQGAANAKSEHPEEDREAIETEEQIENDDPEYLARKRAMDEYKDVHRRGWGNRANRS